MAKSIRHKSAMGNSSGGWLAKSAGVAFVLALIIFLIWFNGGSSIKQKSGFTTSSPSGTLVSHVFHFDQYDYKVPCDEASSARSFSYGVEQCKKRVLIGDKNYKLILSPNMITILQNEVIQATMRVYSAADTTITGGVSAVKYSVGNFRLSSNANKDLEPLKQHLANVNTLYMLNNDYLYTLSTLDDMQHYISNLTLHMNKLG